MAAQETYTKKCSICGTGTNMSMLRHSRRATDGSWTTRAKPKPQTGIMPVDDMDLVPVCGAHACQQALAARRHA